MKNFLIIGFQLFALTNLIGQTTAVKLPFYDGFEYPVDKELTPMGTPAGTIVPGQGAWVYASELTHNAPMVVAQPWANSKGLPACKGNAIRYRAGNEDPIIVFEPQGATSGSIYASFLFRINTWKTCDESEFYQTWIYNGVKDYIFSFIKTEDGWPDLKNTYSASIFIKREDKGDGFTMGIAETNAPDKAIFSPQIFELGKDILVVIQYKYTAEEGTGYLWINPTVSSTEPEATVNTLADARADKKIKRTTPVIGSLDKIRINKNTNLKTPDITMDEVRIANTWHEVVGMPAPGLTPKLAPTKPKKVIKKSK
ncbi:MAG: hypothetical protein QG594_2464 [Bacteroidota bacterium]|nr:hypothetical protein [Bacteroidota bacterium]